MTTLVIVESPTKARTIGKFLPEGFRVEACMGHVRDLPGSASEIPPEHKQLAWAREHGINIENDFEPLYVIPGSKRRVVTELRRAVKSADALVIATDEDREGESIGWHLTQVLKPRIPVRRMVFHEITRSAIERALLDERDIDQNLVRAQETRRIMDRLVGYTVSPVLWIKISPGLSAGRVQSVAVRLLVERERERRTFRSGSYWEVKAQVEKDGSTFEALLVQVDGRKVASARDFDETTGRLKARSKAELLDERRAREVVGRLEAATWVVRQVERRPRKMQPYPPFTTSTLQQEANRKLGLSSSDTMRTAQQLYERGYITYMRTDSVSLSQEATSAARRCVEARYGAEYLSPKPRHYATTTKGAQEAHEAIRPAGQVMPTAQDLALVGRDRALYELIWKRTVATQMGDAVQEVMTVAIEAGGAELRSSGKRILFPGFLRAYVEGSDDPNAALEDREVILPDLDEGMEVLPRTVEAAGRETRPPVRYTEASLVEKLEKEGIGRPSTYAAIISTILNREYARRAGKQLVPTFTAFGVNQLMERSFEQFVDMGFTASMEEALDGVAKGSIEWLPYLRAFWDGNDGLRRKVEEGRERIDPRAACTLDGFDDLDQKVRIGRYGPYLELRGDGDDPIRASLPDDLAPADLTRERATALLDQKLNGPTPIAEERETGEKVYLLNGRYGHYVQLGEASEDRKPRRVSLPKGMRPEQVTPEVALGLLSLPRTLGVHPEDGLPVVAAAGRFGPYVGHNGEFRSLAKGDDVLTIGLGRALELLAEEKTRGRGRGPAVLREVGPHPDGGEPIRLMRGRYGPYVTRGGLNATLPRGTDPGELTLDDAVTLLRRKAEQEATRPAKSKSSSGTSRRGGAKGAPAKASGARKKSAGAAGGKGRARRTADAADPKAGEATGERDAGSGKAAAEKTPKKAGTQKAGTKKAGTKKAGTKKTGTKKTGTKKTGTKKTGIRTAGTSPTND